MTIQDAIKSGKPFKLPHMDFCMIIKHVNGQDYFFREDKGIAMGIFATALILSDRWETKDLPDNVIKFDSKLRRPKVTGGAR